MWAVSLFTLFWGQEQCYKGLQCCECVIVEEEHCQGWELCAFKWTLLIFPAPSVHNWVAETNHLADCWSLSASQLPKG